MNERSASEKLSLRELNENNYPRHAIVIALGANVVLGLNQTTRVMLSRYVMQPDIARQRVEKGNSITNQYRHSSDDDALNEACSQEPLNRDPSVDVEVVGTTSSEFCNDLGRSSSHLLHSASARRRQVNGLATQDHNPFVTIWPGRQSQNLLEGLAAQHKSIDACHELVVAVGFAAAGR